MSTSRQKQNSLVGKQSEAWHTRGRDGCWLWRSTGVLHVRTTKGSGHGKLEIAQSC
jgi:hypothetical protein